MSIITISSIFNNDYDDYIDFCNNTVVADFIDTTTFETTLTTYIYNPIWLRYKDTPIKFSNDEKGQDAFLRNFYNQLSEVVFDFHNYAKENIEYFLYQNDVTKQGKPMSKTITSGIAPINQKIDQALDSTNLASGTGSQFVSETVFNGVAWHKLVEGYFTPNRKTEMLKTFQWLFVSVYSPETKYDDKIEQVRTVDLWFRDEEDNPIDEQHVFPTKSYFTMSEVIINKPEDLVPEHIKRGEVIAGVFGSYEIPLLEYVSVALDLTDDMSIKSSDYGYEGMKEVVVEKPATAVPENIAFGVNIGGVVGTYTGLPDKTAELLNQTITSYSSPDVTTLKPYAFQGCTSLTTVDLPNVTTFKPYGGECNTFRNCTALQSVNLPNLTTVSRNVFVDLGSAPITSLSLPKLTAISRYFISFGGSIANITFGALGSFSEQYCITGASSLTDITLAKDSVCYLANVNAIPASSGQHITIHVPSSLISSYQTASNWSTLYNNGYITFVAI